MAYIETSPSSRRSPKVDFTAMVDLAFLLITFFMLTTALSRPVVMPVVMPDDSGAPQPLRASEALTILAGPNDQIYWYQGLFTAHIERTDYSKEGLRALLLQQKTLLAQERPKAGLYVIIKPLPTSRYKNLVDLFDELHITAVPHYVMQPPTPEELAIVP